MWHLLERKTNLFAFNQPVGTRREVFLEEKRPPSPYRIFRVASSLVGTMCSGGVWAVVNTTATLDHQIQFQVDFRNSLPPSLFLRKEIA
ncbi:hypothetical protein BDV26DRAFT_262765 [Aspergillus bertholletiae]|uniref:Uncharacterized protein n=1 Tax=Aspergillus bertholletiae TaxID=1226010 RepID=A0A5N7B7T8_9EURO|nr:hypothetical protein BDV26DRAFT_262765 [Aspergillus bertholletiae]